MLGFQEAEIGHGPEEWLGRLHCDDLPRVMLDLENHRSGHTRQFDCEYRILDQKNIYRWMHSRGLAINDESGRPVRMAGSQTDITAGKVADALTGLPNRVLFMDRLTLALRAVQTRSSQAVRSLVPRPGRLQERQRQPGSSCRRPVAGRRRARLERTVRSHGLDRLSRAGPDHRSPGRATNSPSSLTSLAAAGEATVAAQRLMAALAAPFDVCGKEVFVGASIGITPGRCDYESAEDILHDADTAMYSAKAQGKARFAVFDETMRARVVARLQLENDLRRAVEQGEFRLQYQPILSLRVRPHRRLRGTAPLGSPARGEIDPGEFIPIAEETGLIMQLGHWALGEACRQMSEWHTTFPAEPPLRVAVSLSSKQFIQPDLVEQVERSPRRDRPAPTVPRPRDYRELVDRKRRDCAGVLASLRSLGVQVSIDDFGTSYSSLSYFQKFTVDTVKIDRSFVREMGSSERQEIVQAIVTLAHNLKLSVIAEGVETEADRGRLKALDCDYVQGYVHSHPVDSDGAAALMASRSVDHERRQPGSRPEPMPQGVAR